MEGEAEEWNRCGNQSMEVCFDPRRWGEDPEGRLLLFVSLIVGRVISGVFPRERLLMRATLSYALKIQNH